ncbi:MAG TPA: tRNA (adenosine(37)-N6)-threonylcarbamoyltransferase complex dimerization subunit type 1 TsaB, partial [Bryobacteraceae bacterium]|nr:tRNA (adenosine(37)-N6)-threonylcarbamoyltransferase complex dimerization subunit type 1 TsaB [Bryobacteraceae bacterium]
RLEDIDLFAGASGPGSFTGVRIGLAAIKGLAEVLGKPAIAVSNLEALAEYGSAALRATVIDARRGEIYGALYDRSGAQIIPETVVAFPKFLELLGDREFEWIATNFDPFRDVVTGAKTITTAPRALAGAIAKIAMRRLESGAVSDPAAIEANYVRRSDAELLRTERAALRRQT